MEQKENTVVFWGLQSCHVLAEELDSLLKLDATILIKPDKDCHDNLTASAFKDEIEKLSAMLTVPHELVLEGKDFEYIIRLK